MTPYIGEIKMIPFANVPRGWASCNGQKLSITENRVLYAIIGNTYGGDDKTYFNLPDMRGRAAVGAGYGIEPSSYYPLGQKQGSEKPDTKDVGTKEEGVGVQATTGGADGGQPVVTGVHSNIQPSVALNFIIALIGLYPSPY